MREFYSKPVIDQILEWYKKKLAQEVKPKQQCVICKSLNIPRGLAGINATFERHADGRLTAVCGGRDGEPVCPGYNITREVYVDQSTITSEIREAMRYMRKELKVIRDRVLATEELTKEDETAFREMTGEYLRLKQIEDAHKEEIDKMSKEHPQSLIEDDEVLVPDLYYGVDDMSYSYQTPMIKTIRGEKQTDFIMNDVKVFTMSQEDIPVLLKIDEAADDE
jgi:hypothetical protein